MLKTHNLFRKMRVALLLVLPWLLPNLGLSQTTCATATTISDSYNNNALTSSDSVIWYQFTATRTDGRIQLLTNSNPCYTSMDLYSGSCASLVHRDASKDDPFGPAIDYSALTVSSTYFIKVRKSGTSTVSYGLAIMPNIYSVACTTCYPTTCDFVCNNSFENVSSYPSNFGFINNIYCWGNPNGNPWPATSDQYNSSGSWQMDVPNSLMGYEPAHTGNGYAGIITYDSGSTTPCEWHEYVTGRLTTTLTAGQRYRVSFWASLADNARFAAGYLGAYLTAAIPNQGCATVIVATPQIEHPTVITQDNGWTLVTSTFIASGGEQYITVGSFRSYANSNITSHSPDSTIGSGFAGTAYYFIDDVSVKEEPLISISASPSGGQCVSTPITFTATSSNGTVSSYSWAASQGSVTCLDPPLCSQVLSANNNIAPITYTITCTLPSGCTSTATYTYTGLAGPTSANATDQNICLGNSAVLTATVTGVYNSSSWAILNSSTLCTGCTSTTVTPTTTTQYVFTATQTTTGCTKKDTVTVTVTPLTVTIISPPGATVCNGWFNFTTSTAYSSYLWSTNAVTSTGGTTSTLSALWGSPFNTNGQSGNVSVSVVDANGCQGSAVIAVPSCCPFSTNVNLINDSTSHVDAVTDPTLYSIVSGYYVATNRQFSINGQYIVDRNTRWEGCEVKLGPNAKIIIRPGITFELTNWTGGGLLTKLYACTDMWDGIYVDGTNSATKINVLNGTVIEDAKNAIVSTNGGTFFIAGSTGLTCKFNKNNIGVLVKAYSGTHPGIIRNTIFSCDAPGQPGSTSGVTYAGTGCRAPINGIGYAGVYIENCNNITIGDSTNISYRNLFERTQFGVYATGSNVKVWNNDFKYFTSGAITKNVPPNGIAVYVIASKFNAKNATVGRAGNYKAKNKFQKCSYGVFAYSYINLTCEYNRFDTCMTAGITTQNCQSNTVLINQDTLNECWGTSIQCIQSTGSTVTISNNSINSNSFVAASFGSTGIYVVQSALTSVNLTIKYNVIKKVRNGIWVSRVKGAKITDNGQITFLTGQPTSQLWPCIGIKLEEVHSSMIRQNTIVWNTTPSAGHHDEMFGIHMTNCVNDTVCKNALTKMGSGIFLKGTCNPVIVACNNMTSCYYGVNFNFLNNYGTGVSVNHQITWGGPTAFFCTGNTWSTVSGGKDLRGRIQPISGNGIKWYYPNATTAPSHLMWTLSLYGGVPQDTSTGDKCSQMLAPPSQGAEVQRNYNLEGICKSPRTYDTLSSAFQYHDQVYAYRMLRENPSWTSLGTGDDSYYSNFYSTHSSGNIGKFANVEDSITAGKITGATTLLNSISPSGQYETNRKALLGVFLRSWAIDSMNISVADSIILVGIINQGVISGGTSVFDARNMLRHEGHDSTVVRMMNPALGQADTPIISPAYPNPTTGSLSIQMSVSEEQKGTFQIFDLTGRVVGSWQFIGGQEVYTFDASNLPPGTYIYCVSVQGELLKSDRIVIIRE